MAVIISGVLKDPFGNVRDGVTIELVAIRTSTTVLVSASSSSITDTAGRYSLNVEPGQYNVMVSTNKLSPVRVGSITVTLTSKTGTLNDFLTMPSEDDITPEIVATVDRMRAEAANSAAAAKTSETNIAASATAIANALSRTVTTDQTVAGAVNFMKALSVNSIPVATIGAYGLGATSSVASTDADAASPNQFFSWGAGTPGAPTTQGFFGIEGADSGSRWQMAFIRGTATPDLSIRVRTPAGAWSPTWSKIWHTGNLPSPIKVGQFGIGVVPSATAYADKDLVWRTGTLVPETAPDWQFPIGWKCGLHFYTGYHQTTPGVQFALGQSPAQPGAYYRYRATGSTDAAPVWAPTIRFWDTENLPNPLKVGDYGLGGTAAIIIADANTAGSNQFIRFNTNTPNSPSATAAWGGLSGGFNENVRFQIVWGQGSPTNDVRTRVRITDGTWSPWAALWHSTNTTVDANGFLKKASPIVKLFGDGSNELNDQSQGVTTERIDTGHYIVHGVFGFNSDPAWGGPAGGIEIPTDQNKRPLIWVDYNVLPDGDLEIKTYHRAYKTGPEFTRNIVLSENGKAIADGTPIDIPAGRWIDLRVEMPAGDEPEPVIEPEPIPEPEAVPDTDQQPEVETDQPATPEPQEGNELERGDIPETKTKE